MEKLFVNFLPKRKRSLPKSVFLVCDLYDANYLEEGMQEWESEESLQYLVRTCQDLGIECQMYQNGYEFLDEFHFNYEKYRNQSLVWNLVEGMYSRSREGYVPAFCEWLGIGCVGSDAYSQVVTLDKFLFKQILPRTLSGAYGLGIPDQVSKTIPYPYPIFVKPRFEGSSMGVGEENQIQNPKDWKKLFQKIQKSKYLRTLNPKWDWLWEEYLPGKEYTVCLLESTKGWMGISAEVRYPEPVYSQIVKSKERMPETIHPIFDSTKSKFLIQESIQIAIRERWEGYARLDWKENSQGNPILLEANLTPGLSPIYSLYPKIWEEFAGLSYQDLIFQILQISWKNYQNKKRYEYGKKFQQRMDPKIKRRGRRTSRTQPPMVS